MKKVTLSQLNCPTERIEELEQLFESRFGAKPSRWFSAPGRSEICGNHTDHNRGKVMAAAVNLDVIAAVEPTDDGTVTVKSVGHEENRVDISELSVLESEKNTSTALVK